MNQTKIGYYAELFVYPTVVGGLLVYDLDRSGFALHLHWWFAAVCGAMLWTLTEYLIMAPAHLALEKDAPFSRTVERAGQILCRPILGGLHHQYVRI